MYETIIVVSGDEARKELQRLVGSNNKVVCPGAVISGHAKKLVVTCSIDQEYRLFLKTRLVPQVNDDVPGLGTAIGAGIGAVQKLRILADWFEKVYPTLRDRNGNPLLDNGDQVHSDLRSIANHLAALKENPLDDSWLKQRRRLVKSELTHEDEVRSVYRPMGTLENRR